MIWVYLADRAFKLALALLYLRRYRAPAPEKWPSLTLLQPITQGWCNLDRNLESRRNQDYPGEIQHVYVVDDLAESLPEEPIRLGPPVHSKLEKLLAALPHAENEVLVFVDDDVELPPDALRRLVAGLTEPGTGATFGLARCPRRDNAPTRLLSAFLNDNAPLSYLPLARLIEPYTITGHIFCIPRPIFDEVGGLAGMENRIDDDHELARRLRAHGYRCRQTPVVYDLHNRMSSWSEYAEQMKRWFLIPRYTMPVSATQSVVSLALTLGTALPVAMSVAGDLRWIPVAIGVDVLLARFYRMRPDPFFAVVAAVVCPLQVAAAWLLQKPTFQWRGRRWQL